MALKSASARKRIIRQDRRGAICRSISPKFSLISGELEWACSCRPLLPARQPARMLTNPVICSRVREMLRGRSYFRKRQKTNVFRLDLGRRTCRRPEHSAAKSIRRPLLEERMAAERPRGKSSRSSPRHRSCLTRSRKLSAHRRSCTWRLHWSKLREARILTDAIEAAASNQEKRVLSTSLRD
jgi:hypothetical protein